MTTYENNDLWSARWHQLNETLPRETPKADEIEDARTRLLKKVTFTDAEVDQACDSNLVLIQAEMLDDPEQVSEYACLLSRYARINKIVDSERSGI